MNSIDRYRLVTFIMAHVQMEINGLMKTPNLFRQLAERNYSKGIHLVKRKDLALI